MGLPPAVANGCVYICTNCGAVAALDGLSGAVRWIRVYDRVKVSQNNRFGGEMAGPSDFWGPNPPIVYKNLLIVTPQDSDMLYAYYTEDGKTDKGKPYEPGQRKYHIERAKKDNTDDGGLKHVLGLIDGNLVITGTKVHFFDAMNGKISGPGEPIATDSPIWGRGAVTEDTVFVPTEKSLVVIDAKTVKEDGKDQFTAKFRDEYKWPRVKEEFGLKQEIGPKEQAGNVFIAGDVLYTVSHNRVNAFFVWEEMEKKLKEKIAKDAGDLPAYIDLAEVYMKVDHYDEALASLDAGEAQAVKMEGDARAAAHLARMRTQRFEALRSLGDRAQAQDSKKAYEYYKKAYATAQLPNIARELPVMALQKMADNAQTRGDAAIAVQHYQEILSKYGDVTFAFTKGSSSQARLFAQGKIEELRKKDPASYEKVEAQAGEALTKAGADVAALEAIVSNYPNSAASKQALLKLAQAAMGADPDRARLNARRFIARAGNSPEQSIGPGAAGRGAGAVAPAFGRQGRPLPHRRARRFSGGETRFRPAQSPDETSCGHQRARVGEDAPGRQALPGAAVRDDLRLRPRKTAKGVDQGHSGPVAGAGRARFDSAGGAPRHVLRRK